MNNQDHTEFQHDVMLRVRTISPNHALKFAGKEQPEYSVALLRSEEGSNSVYGVFKTSEKEAAATEAQERGEAFLTYA